MAKSNEERLSAIERRLSYIEGWLYYLTRKTGAMQMATQEAIDRLKAAVTENTNVRAAVIQALQGYLKEIDDLTKQLQTAIDDGGVDDSTVISLAEQLEETNQALHDAIPAVADAVVAHTGAAA
jgi:small-conductance mechanosensitive channel